MKEITIDELMISILNHIMPLVNQSQLSDIKNILYIEFNNLSVYKNEYELSTRVDDNVDKINMFLANLKIEGCTDNTLKAYALEYKKMFEYINKNYKDIQTNDIRMYLAYLKMQRKNSDVTINNKIRYLNTFFSWLAEEDYIIRNPMRKIKQSKIEKKIKEIYTEEQEEILRCNCKAERDIAIVDLLNSSGMRISELVSINIKDVDFDKKCIKIMGKGRKERIIYFSGKAKLHIKKYLSERTDDNEALFVTKRKPFNRLQGDGIRSMIKSNSAAGEVVLFHAHPHKYRRTFATNMIDRGAPVANVQGLMGHSSSKTTLDCYYTQSERRNEETFRRYSY